MFKVTKHSASIVIVVLSNFYVPPSPREAKNNIFYQNQNFELKKNEHESNPIPYLEWENWSRLAALVSLRAPIKQSFNVKSVLALCDHISNSETMKY